VGGNVGTIARAKRGKPMSAKKFEAMVADMIHKAPMVYYDSFSRVGRLLNIAYSDLMSIREDIAAKKQFVSKIRKNGIKRIKSVKSRF
jgi:hypothetical protein